MKRLLPLAAVAVLALLAAACGGDDSSGTDAEGGGGGGRTVAVKMVDIGFEPSTVDVKKGETVKFTFTNNGKLPHDAFIGDEAAQEDHEMEMRSSASGMSDGMSDMSGMGGHSGEGTGGITVQPGETGELTHTFDEAGTLEIGCHQPGHYAAGMKVAINVT